MLIGQPANWRQQDRCLRCRLAPLLLLLLILCEPGCASTTESSDLPRVTPERIGWSSAKLEQAANYAEQTGSAAVMALYDGNVFFSWGDVSCRYQCHSIRKPLMNSLYGIHVARGDIDLDATLEDLGIDDIPPELTPEEKQATVRHLLQACSGVYHDAAGEVESMAQARPKRGSHAPCAFFYYNNWDFNVLGTIFSQQTGQAIFKSFEREVADPLGMQDFTLADCNYSYEPDKSEHPVYAMRMSTRDMARFGLLYQNGGRWGDTQIIPSWWIAESTTSYSTEVPEIDGYGYMWRVPAAGSAFKGGFYHTGLGVHLLGVLPEQKLVLVHRVDTDRPFDITWNEIRTLIDMIAGARE